MVHKAFLLFLVVVGVSAKLRPDYVLKESRHHAPRSVAYFKDAGKANPTDEHKIVFAVHQNNLDELNRVFRSVSDPTSKRGNQYKTPLRRQPVRACGGMGGRTAGLGVWHRKQCVLDAKQLDWHPGQIQSPGRLSKAMRGRWGGDQKALLVGQTCYSLNVQL